MRLSPNGTSAGPLEGRMVAKGRKEGPGGVVAPRRERRHLAPVAVDQLMVGGLWELACARRRPTQPVAAARWRRAQRRQVRQHAVIHKLQVGIEAGNGLEGPVGGQRCMTASCLEAGCVLVRIIGGGGDIINVWAQQIKKENKWLQ